MSSFTTGIEALVLRVIENALFLLDTKVFLDPFPDTEKRERELVARLIEAEWVRHDHLEETVERTLIRLSKKMYQQVERSTYPDHVDSPPALAYGLLVGVFLADQVRLIRKRLDHGESLEEYKERGRGLKQSVIKQLRAGSLERGYHGAGMESRIDLCEGTPFC